MQFEQGWLQQARKLPSPHCNVRPAGATSPDISLLVIHNISLPPGQFGVGYIDDLFLGQLNPAQHPFFEDIYQLQVSAHYLIARDGQITQYVANHQRAWHAGVSSFQGRGNCNDYSLGIELQGTDDLPYTHAQYQCLSGLTRALQQVYPAITLGRIVGHNDIAPGRKTDPGSAFDWGRFRQSLTRE